MPMNWNAEADAKLLSHVFEVCNVQVTSKDYDTLATAMGCTPKAIKHRILKLRNVKKDDANAGGEAAAPTKPAKATKAVAGGKKKATGGGKKQAARTPSPGGGDDDDVQVGGARTPPPSDRPKRGGAKRDYGQLAGENGSDDEEEADGLNKKVKIEVGEDIGEGLRQVNEGEEEAEMDGAGFFQ
ncbi:hypothetical protein LTR85_007017 [Meristemomyces frigidus]|nr:hypothetical protein LTR85_007017 [Meristemomyces frigidus]